MSKKKLYIITEGSHDLGFGHIARCLSFYERFVAEGYDVEMLVDGEKSCDRLLTGKNYRYIRWFHETRLLDFVEGSVIFLDSLRATQEQVDYLQKITSDFVVIDDYQRRNYIHAIIIDWTPNVENTGKHLHNFHAGNRLLLGIGYSVLRKDMLVDIDYKFRKLSCITIIMGGSDIRNLTPVLANRLGALASNWQINVILGPGTADFLPTTTNICLYRSLDATKIREVFLNSDLVISAGGQTIFELAYLGVPTIPIQVIDNQTEDLQGLLELGFYDEIFQWDDLELPDKVASKIEDLISMEKRKQYMALCYNRKVGKGMEQIIRAIYEFCHESI